MIFDSGYVDISNAIFSLEDSVVCLHEDVHFLTRDFLPFSLAVLIFVLGCVWFYRTFIK